MEQQLREQQVFESFLLKQVRRMHRIYIVCAWIFRLLAAASVVMFIAGIFILHLPVLKGLTIPVLGFVFLIMGSIYKSNANAHKLAAEEMEYGLSRPECNVPDDYEDGTKRIRRNTCNTLKSARGLIISYGILAAVMWVFTPLMFYAAGVSGDLEFSPILLALAFVLPAMALPLTLLTIAYSRDYAAAKHFMPRILQVLDE